MTTHVDRGVDPRLNIIEGSMTFRVRDFMSMNPPSFLRSKIGEDPKSFLKVCTRC